MARISRTYDIHQGLGTRVQGVQLMSLTRRVNPIVCDGRSQQLAVDTLRVVFSSCFGRQTLRPAIGKIGKATARQFPQPSSPLSAFPRLLTPCPRIDSVSRPTSCWADISLFAWPSLLARSSHQWSKSPPWRCILYQSVPCRC